MSSKEHVAENQDLLMDQPLKELGFSSRFIRTAKKMGVYRLRDLSTKNPAALTRDPAFNYLWLEELTKFLQSNHLLHLLQFRPENTND